MAKAQIRYGFNSQIMEMLVDFGIPFTATITNSTIKIDTGDTVYLVSPKHLKYSELGFVSQVKKNAEQLGAIQQNISRSDINYFKFSSMPQGIYRNVSEFDVNSAYWELAYRSGYLREDHYLKGLEVDKVARIVALGAMATTKRVYRFNGYEFEDEREEIVNPVTRSYFFHVAKQLDDIMNEIFTAIPEDLKYLYWVDAFFVDSSVEKIISEGLKDHGLHYKHKEVRQLNCFYDAKARSKKIVATMVESRKKDRTNIYLKPFTRPSTEKTEAFIKESKQRYKKFFG